MHGRMMHFPLTLGHLLERARTYFPDREIVGIYSGDFIWGFGAMHCMTQQQPGF